jgi:DNA polymerase III subunit delta'
MKFSEILGNKPLKEKLAAAVMDGRISHAQLFTGKQGGGNLQMALAYASFIHCENKTENDSCGTCRSCIKYKKLVHPDLHFTFPIAAVKQSRKPKCTDFLEQWRDFLLTEPYKGLNDWLLMLGVENKQGFIPVEESEDVVKKLSLKSYESKYKIQIIWLPEKMAAPASNKLLKIIEEPPENTLFILISEYPDQLLPTIVSRTQQVKLSLVDDNELMNFIAAEKNIDLKHARRIAHLCNGDIGKALEMASYADSESGNEDRFINWMRLLLRPIDNYLKVSAWIDSTAATGRENQKTFLKFAQEAVRECLVANHGSRSLVRFDNDVIENFDKFSVFIHAGNAEQLMLLLNRAYYAIERNANPKVLFLDLSFNVSNLLRVPNPRLTEQAVQ